MTVDIRPIKRYIFAFTGVLISLLHKGNVIVDCGDNMPLSSPVTAFTFAGAVYGSVRLSVGVQRSVSRSKSIAFMHLCICSV